MGITDVFRTKQFKDEAERLTAENEYLKTLLSPEMKKANDLRFEIQKLTLENQQLQSQMKITNQELNRLTQTISSLDSSIQEKNISTPNGVFMKCQNYIT